jgi:serine/threonine protein kinase/tetratricopeptide (TPR) repeat protein
MVLIISPQSVGSNQVTTEVVRAHEDNKAFIPLLSGISHEEFQRRAPVWRQALGASTSIEVSEGEVGEVVGRVIEGLVALGIRSAEQGKEEERSRVIREAQAMARLGDHPHILQIHDLGEENGQPYMVLPFMPGGDVEVLIEKAPDHRLPLEQVVKLSKEVCRGLEFAHSRGIVHRDLKPSNVWMTTDGTAKLGDFGLAVAADRVRLTQEGMMVGTVSYMPPEQAMGGEVTPKADLYSLGAMLYEMVTGRPPFLGDDSVAIIGQHINTPPVAPTWHNSACPRALEALTLRLLAKDPSERPGSASDVLAALDGLDLTATAESSMEEAQPLDSLAGGVFVGRQREMGELKACLEDALSGRGRLVTLVGEPGIGKTRTAQELATYAGLRSAQVLWGRCYEEQGMPPYWPWVQAIRSYVREREPDQLRSEMGAGAADIAEVVSDVKERLPDLSPPPQLDSPEQARFRLFDSITAFLKSASQKQPLVLVLDDLHWADQPSLLLLQFVARELGNSRLLLVGTYRDVELSRQHPLAETLGELTRERLFQRVLLRGLSQQDVARFIEVAAGVDPPAGLTVAVHTQTEGNPLFVTEVVRLLVQEGELTQDSGTKDSWTVRIPEGVREVIGRRLNRLSQRCNETLTIASIIGREFELRQLAPLVEDVSEDRLLEVLEEALGARVVEELPQTVGRYQFTHALIQETLAEELSSTRRARLHARIAESLEELYGNNAEAHAAELSHHFAEAQALIGNEKLLRYSLLAGERALAVFGWEEALAYFQRGLDAKDVSSVGSEAATDTDSATLLFGLGRAQAATLERGQMHQAVDTLGRALDYYAEVGAVEEAVAVAEYPLYPLIGQSTGNARLIQRALSIAPPESQVAGHLLSRYGRVMAIEEGDYDSAKEAFDQALSIAQGKGDTALEMRTLADAGNVDMIDGRFLEGIEKTMRAIELSGHVDDPYANVLARYTAGLTYLALGDLARMGRQASAALSQAERLRDRFWLTMALRINEDVAHFTGDWQTAREFSDRGLALSPREARSLFTRAVIEYQVGDFTQGETYLQRLVEVMYQTPLGPTSEHAHTALAIPLAARISARADFLEAAEFAAGTVLSTPSRTGFMDASARIGLVLLGVCRNDVAPVEDHYAALKQHAGRLAAFAIIATDRVLGLFSMTAGNLDQAAEHMEDALTFCRKAGCRPELAWTCCDYADTLLERNESGDRAKATFLLDESLAISSELGMRPLMERVLSRREILGA